MDVQINYWGVLLATAASFAVGGIWYSKGVFGNLWAKLAKVKMDKQVSSADMTKLMLTQGALSFVTAYVLAYLSYIVHAFYQGSWLVDSLSTAVWVWLAFTFCRFWTHDMFEGRPVKLTLLNATHELVTLLAMAAAIGWLHP